MQSGVMAQPVAMTRALWAPDVNGGYLPIAGRVASTADFRTCGLVQSNHPAWPQSADIPGQQINDPVDLVVRDAGKGVGEPGLGIDAAQLGGFDQGLGDGNGFAAGL